MVGPMGLSATTPTMTHWMVAITAPKTLRLSAKALPLFATMRPQPQSSTNQSPLSPIFVTQSPFPSQLSLTQRPSLEVRLSGSTS